MIWTGTMIFVFAFAAGCKKQVNEQDAIRASIEKHLSARSDLNLSAMDREVKQISVNGDHATAQVEFRLKQGNASMQVAYALERRAENGRLQTASLEAGRSALRNGVAGSRSPGAGSNSLPQGHPPAN